MKLSTVLQISIFILLIAHPLTSITEWQQTSGPGCGIVNDLLADGSNLFATAQGGGVFLSTDNAESWTSMSDGLSNPYTLSLAKSDNYLFTGTTTIYGGSGGGIYRSSNNGGNWELCSSDFTLTDVRCLTANGANIYAGTSSDIYTSADEGSSWAALGQGIASANAILCNDSYIYAATSQDGIYMSADDGSTWTTINNGLTSLSVKDLIFIENTIFAATSDGVFLSSDNGTTWAAANTGLTVLGVMDLDFIGSNLFAATYSGGVFTSDNNGTSWTEINSGLENYYLYSLASNGDNLYAGSFGAGVYRTEDNGTNWTHTSEGMTGGDIRCFTENDDYFFVSTGGCGVFRSDDNGENWTNVGLDIHWVYSLTEVSDGVGGSILLAGTMGEGMFRSTDNGDTWSASSTGITVPLIWSLKVIPIEGENWVFAGLWGGGVAYSTDLGITWTAGGPVPGAPLITSIVHDGTFLYASSFASGVFRSSDNGTSWMPVNTGLNSQYVHCLFLDGITLYAGTMTGLAKSTDNGMSWLETSEGMGENGVYTLITYEDYMFAGCNSSSSDIGGTYYSVDEGTSWNEINAGLQNTNIRCLTVKGMNLLAGTYGGGIMKFPIVLPDPVQLILPEDEAELGSIVDFSWEENMAETAAYCFEISSDVEFTTSDIDSTLTIPSTQIQFEANGEYWWRVKTKNAAGWGEFSEIRSFTTVATVLDIPTDLVVDEYTAEMTWNAPGAGAATEFRYDDGIATAQLGFGDNPSSVMGGSYFNNAVISEVTWLLTSNAIHTEAVLYIFGLDAAGIPDTGQLLHESTPQPNIDDSWNTYTLPTPVDAPNGFFVGVCTPDIFTAIGTDDGVDEPYLFQDGTQMGIADWTAGNDWLDVGPAGFPFNFTIRALGMDLGELTFAPREPLTGNGTEVLNYSRLETPIYETTNTRDLTGYEVFLDGASVANVTETNHTLTGLVAGTTYEAGVTAVYDDGSSEMITVSFTYTPTSGEENNVTAVTALGRNYPNPFNPTTNISFALKEAGNVTLEVYNAKGQIVKTLVRGEMEAAQNHVVTWNGDDDSGNKVSSGVYFYKMHTAKYSETKKMLLMK